MFCPIVRVDLKTSVCPARSCMYKNSAHGCAYEELTADDVNAATLATVKGEKLYKVKALATAAKENIQLGLVVMKYADYIQTSFPSLLSDNKAQGRQTVNEGKDSTRELLNSLFGLSEYQQEKFLCPERYSTWAKRHNLSLEFHALWEGLIRAGKSCEAV